MKNKNEKVAMLKRNAGPLKTFMYLLCVIFIVLLVYIVGGLMFLSDELSGGRGNAVSQSEYFKDCEVLEDSCIDITCRHYTRCGDEAFQACTIYDCGREYGIYVEDFEGKSKMRKEAKPDLDAVKAKKEACQGNIYVLSQDCLNGKTEIKARIETVGECEIGGFNVIFEDAGVRVSDFTASGDGTYSITSNYCGKISSLTAKTRDGISLDLDRK